MKLEPTSGNWHLGLVLSIFTALLWGILPIALSVITQVVDVYTITWFRSLTAFGLLAVYLASQRKLIPPQRFPKNSLKLLAIAAIFFGIFKL